MSSEKLVASIHSIRLDAWAPTNLVIAHRLYNKKWQDIIYQRTWTRVRIVESGARTT